MADHKKPSGYEVPFDHRHFGKLKEKGQSYSISDTFTQIYHSNLWAGADSVSGQGSGPDQTAEIAAHLPGLLKQFHVRTLLDLPCGDFNWMSRLDLDIDAYTGGDIVAEVILKNQRIHAGDRRRFMHLDITSHDLPGADLVFCRDCLVHLSYEDIFKAFANIKRSNITYILTTTFTGFAANHDIVTGDWRPLNLQQAPFHLPQPMAFIEEKCSEGGGAFSDKGLGLWKVMDI
jgi:hypothetical protein